MITPRYLAVGLRLGLVEYSDVQLWVDSQIGLCDTPSDELLRLAYTKEGDIHGLYNSLCMLSVESSEYDEVRKLLKEIEKERLESIEFCWRLTQCLYAIWIEHDYSAPADLNAIGSLEDEYTLATSGIYGTVEEWHASFKEFVASLD